jgi:hypothetical protein
MSKPYNDRRPHDKFDIAVIFFNKFYFKASLMKLIDPNLDKEKLSKDFIDLSLYYKKDSQKINHFINKYKNPEINTISNGITILQMMVNLYINGREYTSLSFTEPQESQTIEDELKKKSQEYYNARYEFEKFLDSYYKNDEAKDTNIKEIFEKIHNNVLNNLRLRGGKGKPRRKTNRKKMKKMSLMRSATVSKNRQK